MTHYRILFSFVLLVRIVEPANAQPIADPPIPITNRSALASPNEAEQLFEQLAVTGDMIQQGQGTMEHISVDPGWWTAMVSRSIRRSADDITLSLEEVLYEALTYSEQIHVFRQLPSIRQTAIVEAQSAFDWHAFLDSQWDDLSDPIGNTLTAGPGISRFRDHNLYGTGGLRRRTKSGGQLEIAQRFGWQDTNSQYFIPDQQGTSRLSLNFTQPLMRGRGQFYNNSLVCLATIDRNVAQDELMRQLQAHLLEVSRAYWAIYLERGVLYQKLRTYDRAKKIVDRLELRRNIDAPLSQIQAATATLNDRRSDLARAFMAVKNSEARIRSLVNSPRYGEYENFELLPVDAPSFDIYPVNMEQSLAEAIEYRPEIRQSLRQIKAASVRVGMAKNEMMPVLNLVASAYLAGLAGDGEAGQAWSNQFSQGEPGYSIGLQFEVPLGNRAATARKSRRDIELQQAHHQYQVTLNTISLEVKVAVREVETSQQELLSKQKVVAARETQLDQIVRRWERLPAENTTTNLVLDNILRAQDDLARAEYEFLQAQITYNLSHINLKKAIGSLLQNDVVDVGPAVLQPVDQVTLGFEPIP